MITRLRASGDRGAYAVLYAILVVVLVGMSALVIDLGMQRNDRRANRAAADSGAIAAGAKLGLSGANPLAACKDAMLYTKSSLGLTSTSTGNCVAVFGAPFNVSAKCAANAPIEATEAISNARTIHFTWPVPDDSSYMLQPDHERYSTLTLPAQQASALQDGSSCLRVAVAVTQDRDTPFAAVWPDIDATRTTVSQSVAVAAPDDGPGDIAAPLVVLDQSSCNALVVGGGGGVTVNASTVVNGISTPGVIAVDSDGSGGEDSCNGLKKTISAPSNVNHIWAIDGNSGKAYISSYAMAAGNASKAYDPADVANCTLAKTASLAALQATPQAHLCPAPIAGSRVTDRPWVLRYNCVGSCPQPKPAEPLPAPRDYVDQWARFATATTPTSPSVGWGTPAVPGTYRVTNCDVNAPLVVPGDAYVDCATFRIRQAGRVSFMGRAVFRGNIDVDSGSGAGGCILFNDADPAHCTQATAPTYVPLASRLADGGNVFVSGDFHVGGSVIVNQVFVYVGQRLNASTGDPSVVNWVAPYGKALPPPYTGVCVPSTTTAVAPTSACFDSLGLWDPQAAPSTSPHQLLGGSNLVVDGTLFMPTGYFKFGGQSTNLQDRAQFVARRLEIHGGGDLTMTPDGSRSTLIPRGVGKLIR